MILNPVAEMTIDPSILVQYGAIGMILLWFMFRMEKKMDKHTNIISDLVESITLEVLSRDNLPEHVRARAESILDRANFRKSQTQSTPAE